MGVRECGQNLGVDSSRQSYTCDTENQMWGQRDNSAAVGISAVGDKDFVVGVSVLEHASGQLGEREEFAGKEGNWNLKLTLT
jgi:hypothetical protein